MAVSSEPRSLDPHLIVGFPDMQVSLALFEGLTRIDEATSSPVPAAAASWEVSADGLTYRFRLRPGQTWSDGTAITASDFVFSLRRALHPGVASEYAYVLFPIRGAEAFNAGPTPDEASLGVSALDALTLQIDLERPFPALPSVLALPIAFPVPRHLLERSGAVFDRANSWSSPDTLVGNGPFVLTRWARTQFIRVERNPRNPEGAAMALNAIVFHPTEQASVQEAAFRAGQLHLTSDLPLSKVATYRRDQPGVFRADVFLESGFLRLNTTLKPLDDVRVRRALAFALDRTSLAEKVLGAGQKPGAFLTPPGTAGYTPSARVPDNPEKARALLAEAGFPGGRGFPKLEVMMFSSELNLRLLEAIQALWKERLGIDVEIVQKEHRVWLEDERRLAYALSNARWIGDYPDPGTFLELFLSGSGNNATGWKNPDYDALVRQAGSERDPTRRNALFDRAETLLLDEMPIVPLYHGARTFLIAPSVKGWTPSLLGFNHYPSLRLE
jgi:oligopeptide transport system substrate-binding protein